MKNLKEEKRDILSWQIAQIVNKDYPPISNDNINELVKRMALVNRLGNLLQEYMMLDYNYKNGLISFEMVDRLADGVVQPCYVPATNVVRLDADLIKLYTMEDILITLLHELRHKWQLDQVDYAVQIPHYERYSPKTEKEFDSFVSSVGCNACFNDSNAWYTWRWRNLCYIQCLLYGNRNYNSKSQDNIC